MQRRVTHLCPILVLGRYISFTLYKPFSWVIIYHATEMRSTIYKAFDFRWSYALIF